MIIDETLLKMLVTIVILLIILSGLIGYLIGFIKGFRKAKFIDDKIFEELSKKYNKGD